MGKGRPFMLVCILTLLLLKESYQDFCADTEFRDTFSTFFVSVDILPEGDERTVTLGCRFGYHTEEEDATLPDFTMAQEELHCVNGVWDKTPGQCGVRYYTLLEALDQIDFRNETVWEGEKLEIDFFIKSRSYIAAGPWVFKANGEVVPNATMSGFLRQDRGAYSSYLRWTAYLTEEETGYYYYHDEENAYYDRDLRKAVTSPRYEYFYIKVYAPQHGGWGEWSAWSDCTATCGNSTHYHTRACDNPPPMNGGNNCTGPPQTTEACSVDPCPIHGGWSEWGEWSVCSTTCGEGSQTHSRLCDNPTPEWGGDSCPGDAVGTDVCTQSTCPIDGLWALWSAWSECSQSCGGGTMDHVRTCTDPPPQHGGADCTGTEVEISSCSEVACRTDGNWAQWTDWIPCSKTCGFGSKSRERTCTDPSPNDGGADCPGVGMTENYFQEEDCLEMYDCPVDGQWSEWSVWGNCSLPCGGGEISRTRDCTNPAPSFNGRYCQGNASDIIPNCNPAPCGVDGSWAEWPSWSPCTKTCGGGTSMRNRSCTDPIPTHGGKDCPGTSGEINDCHTERCLDGAWTPWSPWSECSQSCRGGVQARARSCTDPRPGLGGSDCPDSNKPKNYRQWQECNQQPCPIHGWWSLWSAWSECPVTCGGGHRLSERNCSQPVPQWGGRPCPGSGVKMWRCNTKACPLFGAPEGVTYVASDTNITVSWFPPLEYTWPILYYTVHFRQRGNASLHTLIQAKSDDIPYPLYNLTSFRALPTKDNDSFAMTVRGLSAHSEYELCVTIKHGYEAAVSGHSEVTVIRTLKHAFPASPVPVTLTYGNFAMEGEYKVLIRWSEVTWSNFTAPSMYQVMIRDVKTTIDRPWLLLDEVPTQITGHLIRDSSNFNLRDIVYIVQVVASNQHGNSLPAICREFVDVLAAGPDV